MQNESLRRQTNARSFVNTVVVCVTCLLMTFSHLVTLCSAGLHVAQSFLIESPTVFLCLLGDSSHLQQTTHHQILVLDMCFMSLHEVCLLRAHGVPAA
jgi:hypothetical protein